MKSAFSKFGPAFNVLVVVTATLFLVSAAVGSYFLNSKPDVEVVQQSSHEYLDRKPPQSSYYLPGQFYQQEVDTVVEEAPPTF
jgi:peptidoglycan hydrolase-like amidase